MSGSITRSCYSFKKTNEMVKIKAITENFYDEFKDLSVKEIECMKAWKNFEKSEDVKSSNFNLKHWRKVKESL